MATLFIGQNKVFLPVAESTNSYAIDLLKNVNAIEGTVVYTHNQTKGKGQRGNLWITEPQRNATFSLILKPTFLNPNNSFYLSKITALALYDVLTEILSGGQFDIKIKWPNDIMVNNKKIAGVLIENSVSADVLQWCVVGVGINVNQKEFGEIKGATSLYLLCQKTMEVEDVIDHFYTHFEKWYLRLKKVELKLIDETYHKHLLGMGKMNTFEKDGQRFKAKVIGVNESGLLILEAEDGSRKNHDIKEVSFILD